MNTITIEELEQLKDGEGQIVDIRPQDQYERGTFPGAISLPMEVFKERYICLRKDQPVYLLCHTGERSLDYALFLEEQGYENVVNITGGYRAYLRLTLSRYMQSEEEERKAKTAEIERSIIKRYRKTIWRPFTKALNDYQLIQEGDRVAVCISGGKDSMLLAKLIQEL